MLDYLENRNQEVRDIIAQLLLLFKKGRIIVATSIFNITELIDKEFQIYFIGSCIGERMSYDEIERKKGDKNLFKEIAEVNKEKIEEKIENFIFKNEIKILSFSFDDSKKYQEIYELIYNNQLRSQDALIIATAISNNITYFISNDSDLTKHIESLLNTYNLRDKNERENFKNYVLEAV
jgi:hypothetical protein